jgi:hypothetical protein
MPFIVALFYIDTTKLTMEAEFDIQYNRRVSNNQTTDKINIKFIL